MQTRAISKIMGDKSRPNDMFMSITYCLWGGTVDATRLFLTAIQYLTWMANSIWNPEMKGLNLSIFFISF